MIFHYVLLAALKQNPSCVIPVMARAMLTSSMIVVRIRVPVSTQIREYVQIVVGKDISGCVQMRKHIRR